MKCFYVHTYNTDISHTKEKETQMSWALSDGTCNGCPKKKKKKEKKDVSVRLTLQSAFLVDPEMEIWDRAGPTAEGGWNVFKATICLEQIISSLSHYETVMSCAYSISLLVKRSGIPKHVTGTRSWSLYNESITDPKKTINTLLRGGGTPTYRLASSWHPHSWWKREKIIKRTEGHLNCEPIREFSSILTLWSVSLLPTLRRLRRPTVCCRQDAPGCPLTRAKLARSFTVTRFGLLHFHLDKRTSRAHLATPVKSQWNSSPSQPSLNTADLILKYWAGFKYFTLI